MAADLHIHIAKDIPLEEMEQFVRRAYSEHGPDGNFNKDEKGNVLNYDEKKIHNTPNVWVGEVSWLKAALLNDAETFVPSTVQAIADLVGTHLPIINEEFIQRVKKAFDLKNETTYTLNTAAAVVDFLEGHRGERAFQISW